jgi:hypothetical protein
MKLEHASPRSAQAGHANGDRGHGHGLAAGLINASAAL